MEGSTQLNLVEELGEFGLIDRIQEIIQINRPETVKAGGDDAAVIRPDKPLTLVSTDMYVEGVHFDMVYTPLQHLGYKCITGAISDIYAMNGMARHVTVSIAMSSKFSVQAIDLLYSGMQIACSHYGVDLIGGDTTSSRTGMVISVTALGTVDEDKVVYRSGARAGDIICVSGDLGGAFIGLQVLEREKRIFMEHPDVQPELEEFDYVLRRQLRPEARMDIIEQLAALNIVPTSMIDISDGLASEVMHLSRSSGKGCKLFEDKIPIDDNTYQTALKFNIDPTLCALSGGEDYELLFTLKPEDFEKVQNLPDFTPVGHMTGAEGDYRLITKSGNEHPLKAQGWKHF